MSNACGRDEMTPHKDNFMANFGFAIHQLNAQIINGQNVTSSDISEEMKSAIAAEVRAQMVPVVKEIVREVVNEVRNVMTDMVTPLYDELHDFRTRVSFPNSMLYSADNMAMYTSGSSISHTPSCDILDKKVGRDNKRTEFTPAINRSKMYEENNFSSKSQDEYFKEPREPRAQASTSDCAAFSFIYYNTVCLIPISTLLEPENNAFVCQKVPKIFLGKEGGKISFLVDMKTVKLRDLTSDNLGYWTSRFAAHMKTRKYFVKDGQITGRIQQFGQVCHLLQDYDYILHRQYYCHGNTIGPAAIRKNIWYLTGKLNGGQVVGCALISYEIDDNATVKISKLRHKSGMNCVEIKEEVPAEEMNVNSMLTPNAELQSYGNFKYGWKLSYASLPNIDFAIRLSMESYTESELLATINDMGYDLSPEELIFFKSEMDHFLDKLEKENKQQSRDKNVLFSSLIGNDHLAVCDIPCSYDKKELFYMEQCRHLSSNENLELHSNQRKFPRSTSINRCGIVDRDEIIGILDDGYCCLRQITEANNHLRGLNNRLERNLYHSRANLFSSDEVKQNFASGQIRNYLKEYIDEAKSDSTLIALDPAIRPVLHPFPGRVPFRHDPVKKYELYKKGWLENPPPGEKKRLSLRWKVREFMLRREVSRIKPMDLAQRRISNPDWYPRPHLD
ncbi:Centriolar and ciliogenesis-associated protein [Dirofilaria immitis]